MDTPTFKLHLLTVGVVAWTALTAACICYAELGLP